MLMKSVRQALTFRVFHSGSTNSAASKKQTTRLMHFMFLSAGVCMLALEPSVAYATTTATTAGGLEKMVTNIVSVLTGTFGKGIATIAIMAMGIMAMFGKLEWASAVKVIIGIAVTFGAASIVKWLTGGTSFDAISYLVLPASYLV